jgi:hypothetical protein
MTTIRIRFQEPLGPLQEKIVGDISGEIGTGAELRFPVPAGTAFMDIQVIDRAAPTALECCCAKSPSHCPACHVQQPHTLHWAHLLIVGGNTFMGTYYPPEATDLAIADAKAQNGILMAMPVMLDRRGHVGPRDEPVLAAGPVRPKTPFPLNKGPVYVADENGSHWLDDTKAPGWEGIPEGTEDVREAFAAELTESRNRHPAFNRPPEVLPVPPIDEPIAIPISPADPLSAVPGAPKSWEGAWGYATGTRRPTRDEGWEDSR